MSASLGGVLSPLPILSVALTANASNHPLDAEKNGLLIVESPYPAMMNGFHLVVLSDMEPETILNA